MTNRDLSSTLTAVRCLLLVAQFQGIQIEEEKIIHDNVLGKDEPSLKYLGVIASRYGMRHKLMKADWNEILGMRLLWPLICQKKNGKYFLIAGIRNDTSHGLELAVVDPSPDPEDKTESAGMYRFWTHDDFISRYGGRILLFVVTHT